MNEYKNRISILRNILQKSNDQDLTDYVFKKILPKIFNFYMENCINPDIIYNIDNCYKLYYPDLYNELSKSYKLATQDTLIFGKNTNELIILLNYKRIKILILRITKKKY